ncbi:MAG TPA: ABC transporter substrate-binding protein, partial [Pseudomonas sp.]|nr:ABC transporter substrate-binding protein [Pseudomonas sp.]
MLLRKAGRGLACMLALLPALAMAAGKCE